MKLRRVTTDGVRGVPDRLFDFTLRRGTGASRVVVLTGPSGAGKTSLLDAIAAAKEDVAPWGARHSWWKVVRAGAGAAKIRVEWELDADEQARMGFDAPVLESESIFSPTTPPGQGHDPRLVTLLQGYDHDPRHAKMEYFFAERTLAPEAIGLSQLEPSFQKRMRLDRDVRKYGALHKYLTELHLGLHERVDAGEERAGPARFAAAFAKLSPRRVLGLTRTGDRMEVTFDGGAEGPVPVAWLPHAEQQAVLVAATFELLGLSRSVVLFDGPELHRGAAATPAFARGVVDLGADNQVIFATSEPTLADAFPDGVAIDLAG